MSSPLPVHLAGPMSECLTRTVLPVLRSLTSKVSPSVERLSIAMPGIVFGIPDAGRLLSWASLGPPYQEALAERHPPP